MYENQQWLPVATLFGLLGCPIPRVLKAEIFLTLASFAASPEVAAPMWLILETTQVLDTTAAVDRRGVVGGVAKASEGSIQVQYLLFIITPHGDYWTPSCSD